MMFTYLTELHTILVAAPPQFDVNKTRRGLEIGDSIEKVRELYGKPSYIETYGGDSYIFVYEKGKIFYKPMDRELPIEFMIYFLDDRETVGAINIGITYIYE